MVNIERRKAIALMRVFYADYFEEYLNKVIDDKEEELSVVTLFKGMNFFFQLVEDFKIDYKYKNIKEYICSEYENGDIIFNDLEKRYAKEIEYYNEKDSSLEDIFGDEEETFGY